MDHKLKDDTSIAFDETFSQKRSEELLLSIKWSEALAPFINQVDLINCKQTEAINKCRIV